MGLISGIVRDRTGGTLAGATITIYEAGTTTPATLYTNAALTIGATNPMTSDGDGIFLAYAVDANYKWQVARTGFPTETVDNVPCIAPANYAALAGRFGGQTLNFDTAASAGTGKLSSTSHATKGKYFLNAAGTITIDELNTRVGIGTPTPTKAHHVTSSANTTVESMTETTSTGTGASGVVRAAGTVASAMLVGYGSGNTFSMMGVTVGSYAACITSAGNGMLLGPTHAAPLIIGTNSVRRFEIDSSGNGVWNETGADVDLRFESDTNDSLFRLDSGSDSGAGRASFGAAAVQNVALAGGVGPYVLVNHGGTYGLVVSRASGNDGNPASFSFWKTRASAPETKVALIDTDPIGRIMFQGAADSSTAHMAAQIICTVNGTPASSRVPGAISFQTASTAADALTVLTLTSAGVMETPRMHNNGGTGATQAISSGTYTPTLTAVANVAASATFLFDWSRTGNVVNVAGTITVDPTAATTVTTIGITIPVPSNFVTDSTQCNGLGMCNSPFMAGTVAADITNDRAQYTFISDAGAASQIHRVMFQYRVV